MKNAIVIGASSGIGRELARLLAGEGYSVGLFARRLPLLESLAQEIGSKFYAQMDVSDEAAPQKLNDMISRMQGTDLIVYCAGIGHLNPDLAWEREKETIDVNVCGFTCLADAAFRFLMKQGAGQFVAISSIAAIRGSGLCPAYNASKAYMSNYLEGLRCMAQKAKKNIIVTDIQPGLVDTRMAQGEKLFWLAKPEEAAAQIYRLIKKRKEHGYVTRRWGLIAFCFKIMPGWMYKRI